MLNNYPTSNSYMIHIADEMKQVFEGTSDKEIKAYIIDDIYLNKVHTWKWADEELAYLNAGYESLEPKIDFVETEILKRMGEFKNDNR